MQKKELCNRVATVTAALFSIYVYMQKKEYNKLNVKKKKCLRKDRAGFSFI
jgi:hypothetical protein